MHADYTGQGFDQLLDVINKIKTNPDDRRIILSAWNPSDLKLMALPPCHMFVQVNLLIICKFLLAVPVLTDNLSLLHVVLCCERRVILPDVSAFS